MKNYSSKMSSAMLVVTTTIGGSNQQHLVLDLDKMVDYFFQFDM